MEPATDPAAPRLRLLLGVLVLLGTVGLAAELTLMEHVDSVQQWIPFVVFALGLVTTVASLARPSGRTLRLHQAVMVLYLVTGLVGLGLHYWGNVAFEREIEPGTGGLLLLWRAATGAVPALAPGAMIQLGLLGIVQTFRHPALR